METEGFFRFEIIINVSVSFFRFDQIPVLWIYGRYTYLNSFSAGTVFIRQNLELSTNCKVHNCTNSQIHCGGEVFSCFKN